MDRRAKIAERMIGACVSAVSAAADAIHKNAINCDRKCRRGLQLCQKEIDMKRALVTATILCIVTMPAFASPNKHHSAAKSRPLGYAYAPRDNDNAARSEAIQACNAEAGKWVYRDWQTTNITVYRDCMFRHGQPFE
jgi:hypothetical protein